MVVTTEKKSSAASHPGSIENSKKQQSRTVDKEMVRRAAMNIIERHREALKELGRL